MSHSRGFSIPLSLPRRLICDFLYFAARVPTVPVQRHMNLAEVLAARARSEPRPSWCAIFTKAWARVCASKPVLRRAYLSFPWPRLYQYPDCTASIAVERPYGGEDAIFFLQIAKVDEKSLLEIDRRMQDFKDRPLDSAATLRRQIRMARMPRPLRRMMWWTALAANGRWRQRFFGTFGVSVYSSLGAASLHPLGLLTTTLNYGVIAPDGGVDVRIVYDHRTMDGGTIARALLDLERVLCTEIVAELRYTEKLQAA